MGKTTTRGRSQLRAYLQLFRIPAVFTAIADVTMGLLFVRRGAEPYEAWFALIAASSLLYTAGMVLNDVYDVDLDARERPERPLPSGRIPAAQAARLGYGLLIAGVFASALAGYLVGPPVWLAWRSGLVGCTLALTVWLYDAVLKGTPVGPLVMGACRTLNVLMGMSLSAPADVPPSLLHFDPSELLVAVGIGVYVSGVTWYARAEAVRSRRVALSGGLLLMLAGLALLAFFPRLAPLSGGYHMDPLLVWPFALCALMISTVRRCLIGIADPSPRRVQAAVRQCLFSLIVLDAGIILLVAPWTWAVGVLALLIPTLILGRWINAT